MMTAKTRSILSRAIEEGLRHGVRRAYKYDDRPRAEDDWTDEAMERIESEVWLAIDEVFDVRDGDET